MSNLKEAPTVQTTERKTDRSLVKALGLRIGLAALTVTALAASGADSLRSLITGGSVPVAAACEGPRCDPKIPAGGPEDCIRVIRLAIGSRILDSYGNAIAANPNRLFGAKIDGINTQYDTRVLPGGNGWSEADNDASRSAIKPGPDGVSYLEVVVGTPEEVGYEVSWRSINGGTVNVRDDEGRLVPAMSRGKAKTCNTCWSFKAETVEKHVMDRPLSKYTGEPIVYPSESGVQLVLFSGMQKN